MITDRAKRKVKIGQDVDVLVNGMYQGRIVKIVENPIQFPDGSAVLPHIVVQLVVNCHIHPSNNIANGLYITGDGEQEKSTKPKMQLVSGNGEILMDTDKDEKDIIH